MCLRIAACALAGTVLTGCAELNKLASLVQAPQFEQAPDHRAEIRMTGAGSGLPIGGAGVRLWARVTNPNPFSLTLGTLKGTLFLEDARAADVDFPLGLPLAAGGETTVPIDLSVSFANLPGLADSIRRAISRQPLRTGSKEPLGLMPGDSGNPVFGPLTLLRGDVRPIAGP